MIIYNDIIIPPLIRIDRIVSAFCNPVSVDKVELYTEIMKAEMLSHDFPPIWGFPSIISEDNVENEDFCMMDLDANYNIGDLIWNVTDGHHRTLSAINAGLPHFEVELDYNCITNEKDLLIN